MSDRKIIVKIDPRGNATVEAQGFNGQGCTDATKAIEQALAGGGGEVTREFKPEWSNEQEDQHAQVGW